VGRLDGEKPPGPVTVNPIASWNHLPTRRALSSPSADRKRPVWVAMIHSSEIGLNRYFPTEDDVARFRRRCLDLVEDAVALGAVGATLEEVWQQSEKTRSPLQEVA
jgi:hypothetical protein